MKEIPFSKNKTIYDNLTIPVDFYLLYDKKYKYKSSLNLNDKIVLFYFGLKYLLSDKRRSY